MNEGRDSRKGAANGQPALKQPIVARVRRRECWLVILPGSNDDAHQVNMLMESRSFLSKLPFHQVGIMIHSRRLVEDMKRCDFLNLQLNVRPQDMRVAPNPSGQGQRYGCVDQPYLKFLSASPCSLRSPVTPVAEDMHLAFFSFP